MNVIDVYIQLVNNNNKRYNNYCNKENVVKSSSK